MTSIITKNRRLAILKFLAEDEGGSLNTSVLQSALLHIGHGVSREKVQEDVLWLEKEGLSSVEFLEDLPVILVRITPRGVDVARGLTVHPGVDRPLPR